MRGFAHPEDLLLDLRHALVAALDGQVATSDHHAADRLVHRGQQQVE
jgi:hypothetical protein